MKMKWKIHSIYLTSTKIMYVFIYYFIKINRNIHSVNIQRSNNMCNLYSKIIIIKCMFVNKILLNTG